MLEYIWLEFVGLFFMYQNTYPFVGRIGCFGTFLFFRADIMLSSPEGEAKNASLFEGGGLGPEPR